MSSPLQVAFVAGPDGPWTIDRIAPVVGETLAPAFLSGRLRRRQLVVLLGRTLHRWPCRNPGNVVQDHRM